VFVSEFIDFFFFSPSPFKIVPILLWCLVVNKTC
jgi:hypothetical protein